MRKKIALITGASSGLGREFVRQIAKHYPSLDELWVIARRREVLETLQKELPETRLCVMSLDLSGQEAYRELQEKLEQEQPRICLLVNSAGMGKNGPIEKQSWKDGCAMVDVNCRALTAVTMICLPYMKKGSRILQMDSGSAFLPQPGFGIYAATKSYVLSFSRALGEELREQGITVTAVCPGPVDTEFFAAGGIILNPFKKKFLEKPEKVVYQALLAAQEGKQVVITTPAIGLTCLAGKVLPHSIIMKMMGVLLK